MTGRPSSRRFLAWRPDAENLSDRVASFASPPQSGVRLALVGPEAGIAAADCEARQEVHASPQGTEGRMVRQQKRQQTSEDVRAWDRQAEFFQHRLEVFFRTLLTEEAGLVMKRIASPIELEGRAVIGLGLSHPLLRELFHRGPSPAT